MDVNKFDDGGRSVPISFTIRGAWGVNKLEAKDVVQRGFDSARFIASLAFFLELLSYRKTDSNETSYHLRTVSDMLKEFAGEFQEVVESLNAEFRVQIERRDKYRDELHKLKTSEKNKKTGALK